MNIHIMWIFIWAGLYVTVSQKDGFSEAGGSSLNAEEGMVFVIILSCIYLMYSLMIIRTSYSDFSRSYLTLTNGCKVIFSEKGLYNHPAFQKLSLFTYGGYFWRTFSGTICSIYHLFASAYYYLSNSMWMQDRPATIYLADASSLSEVPDTLENWTI